MEYCSNSPISYDYSQLPQETLLHIFWYCDPKSWGRSQLVCQIWRQVCLDDSLRVNIDLSNKTWTKEEWFDTLKKISETVIINRLDLSNSNCLHFEDIPKESLTFRIVVKELKLDESYYKFQQFHPFNERWKQGEFLDTILKMTICLEILSFKNYTFETSYTQDHYPPFGLLRRASIQKHFHLLKKLTISYFGWRRLDFLGEMLPNLLELTLYNTSHIINLTSSMHEREYGLDKLRQRLPNLRLIQIATYPKECLLFRNVLAPLSEHRS